MMSYGEKRRHQYYRVKYRFNYPSGKTWTEERECLCYSQIGVYDTMRFIYKHKDYTILSITPTGRYAGQPVLPSTHVIGEL